MRAAATLKRIPRRARSAWNRLARYLPHKPPPAILMYHRIAEEPFDPWGLSVSPAHFADQLKWMAANRTVLRLQEFADRHCAGTLPQDAIAVTFDDGYLCNAEVARPLLEQFRIPATIFLPVELIEKEEVFWWDELEGLVLNHDGPSLTLGGKSYSIGPKSEADERWLPGTSARTSRQAGFEAIHALLARMDTSGRAIGMAELRKQAGHSIDLPKHKKPMSPAQVREAAGGMIEFGSHSLTHPWLTSLDDDSKRSEIVDSVERCESLSGTRPVTFAYPFGALDEQSERLVGEAGFDCACATKDIAVSRRSSTFALPRLAVGNWDSTGLARMLARARSE